MSWRCKACETLNDDCTQECEVCGTMKDCKTIIERFAEMGVFFIPVSEFKESGKMNPPTLWPWLFCWLVICIPVIYALAEIIFEYDLVARDVFTIVPQDVVYFIMSLYVSIAFIFVIVKYADKSHSYDEFYNNVQYVEKYFFTNRRNVESRQLKRVIKNDKVGIFNESIGKLVLYPKYDNIIFFWDSLIFCILYDGDNEKYGMLDWNGKLLLDSYYEKITEVSKGMFVCEMNQKKGLYNINFKRFVIPTKFNSIEFLGNGFIQATLDKTYTFDYNGNLIS